MARKPADSPVEIHALRHLSASGGSGGNGQLRTSGPRPESSPAQPGSFAGHFGQLIISDGIAPIPRALYLYQAALRLSPQQVWFISYVLAHKWSGDLPHPRLQELAHQATLGLRQIKKIKNSIVQAGLLEVTPRFGSDGEQDANSYDFERLFDRLERLIIVDPAAPADELAEHPDAESSSQLTERLSPADPAVPTVPALPAVPNVADRSFAARYGRVILRRGVAAVPRALFTYQGDLGLSPQQLWFICYILSFQWSTELPYPSLRKMAQNTGYSERQIHRIKDGLASAGYLRVVERQGADGRDTTTAYDFTQLLKIVTTLIRKSSPRAGEKAANTEEARGTEYETGPLGSEAPTQTSYPLYSQQPQQPRQPQQPQQWQISQQLQPSQPPRAGGEPHVSGGVNSVSVEGVPHDSGRVNSVSEGGVNPTSVGRVNSTSYRIESVKEETDKEEPYQQQPAQIDEIDEAHEKAFYALVDVGVFPSTAQELSQQLHPDQILGWIHYYLSVLSQQDNLSNPLGVLVNRLRSGEEAPYVPSSADMHSLRLHYSYYGHGRQGFRG